MPIPRPTARRILLLAVAMGVLVDIAVPGSTAGANAVLVLAAFLAAAVAVAGREGLERFDPADSWVPVAALAFAAMPAIRADDWLVAADLALAAMLGVGTIACLAGARITRGLVPAILSLAAGLLVATLTGATSVLGALRRRRVTDGAGSSIDGAGDAVADAPEPREVPAWLIRSVPVLRGLLLAVPVLALFAILFASADAVFAAVARSALAWQVDIDLGGIAERTFVVTVVAWVVAGLLALGAAFLPAIIPGRAAVQADDASPEPWTTGRSGSGAPPPPPWSSGWRPPGTGVPEATGAASPVGAGRSGPMGTVEAATILAVVGALFAGFVVLQLAYLFGGLDTMSMTGLTYAEYARRGFFELVAVAVLAGMLVVALDLAVRQRSRSQLAASIVLLGLTSVVLVSAFARLRLYQDAYGWTELRFVVVVAIGWLAVALAVTTWLLLARSTRWTLHALGIMVLVTVAGMNVVGPQAFVADRNLERALNPALVPPGGRTGLDGAYLASLGDEAVPAVVAAWPSLAPGDQADMARFLDGRRDVLATDPALRGWPAWNLSRQRARDALAAWSATR